MCFQQLLRQWVWAVCAGACPAPFLRSSSKSCNKPLPLTCGPPPLPPLRSTKRRWRPACRACGTRMRATRGMCRTCAAATSCCSRQAQGSVCCTGKYGSEGSRLRHRDGRLRQVGVGCVLVMPAALRYAAADDEPPRCHCCLPSLCQVSRCPAAHSSLLQVRLANGKLPWLVFEGKRVEWQEEKQVGCGRLQQTLGSAHTSGPCSSWVCPMVERGAWHGAEDRAGVQLPMPCCRVLAESATLQHFECRLLLTTQARQQPLYLFCRSSKRRSGGFRTVRSSRTSTRGRWRSGLHAWSTCM